MPRRSSLVTRSTVHGTKPRHRKEKTATRKDNQQVCTKRGNICGLTASDIAALLIKRNNILTSDGNKTCIIYIVTMFRRVQKPMDDMRLYITCVGGPSLRIDSFEKHSFPPL